MQDKLALKDDHYWLGYAIELACRAQAEDEVPIGAVLVNQDNLLIGEGWNQPIANQDPTAHAEIIALRQAGQRINNYRLLGTTLYTTLEPCIMCAGALVHARVQRLVYGAADPKAGAIESVYKILDFDTLNHRISYQGGLLADECGHLLKTFFKQRRYTHHE